MKPQTEPHEPALAVIDTPRSKEWLTIVRFAVAAKMLGLSRSMLYLKLGKDKRYADSAMPRPVQISARSIGFYTGEILQYLENLKRAELHPVGKGAKSKASKKG